MELNSSHATNGRAFWIGLNRFVCSRLCAGPLRAQDSVQDTGDCCVMLLDSWTTGTDQWQSIIPRLEICTKRKLGMFRGPNAEKLDPLDNEHPELPKNVERAMRASEYVFVFADFEVCPLEPERPGVKQYARIESAKNIAVGK